MAASEFFPFSFSLFFSFLFVCFIPPTVRSVITCRESFCRQGSEPAVRFPFRLYYRSQIRCAYGPDFVLSCDSQRRTILHLPSSGRFVVTDIDYEAGELSINDPDECLPRRFLQNFYIADTLFQVDAFQNFTFVNCSNTHESAPAFESVACLSGENFTVKVTRTDSNGQISPIPPSCHTISTVMVPVTRSLSYSSLNTNITMSWTNPNCSSCEKRGGDCGFTSNTGLEIGCSNLPSKVTWPESEPWTTRGVKHRRVNSKSTKKKSLPRAAKYGIILGAVIPGFLLIVGLGSCICAKVRSYRQRHRRSENISSSGSTVALASVTVVGLDEPTIESYPKTFLGASRRLPKPYDVTCSICLSEYQPEETLRTIPDCGHYFHVTCIDEWLKMNATCPLCRNSPDGSSHASLSSPTSSSSLLSFSSV